MARAGRTLSDQREHLHDHSRSLNALVLAVKMNGETPPRLPNGLSAVPASRLPPFSTRIDLRKKLIEFSVIVEDEFPVGTSARLDRPMII